MRLRRFSYVFVAMIVLLCAGSVVGRPQQQNVPLNPRQSTAPNSLPDSAADANMRAIEERQVHARNDERQKRLVADTDKLLALATQLHDDVGKTNKNILSLDVVKRSEEIEKLAHNIKERMKG